MSRRWADLQVGSTVWIRDRNRSLYVGASGRTTANPRNQYIECRVTAVERLSFVLDGGRFKLDRKTGKVRANDYSLSATLDLEGDLYVEENRTRLAERVMRCYDAEKLRQIAAIVDSWPGEGNP